MSEPDKAVALALLAQALRHRVMASDGDCAHRSATQIASFHLFGPQRRRLLAGTVAATVGRDRRTPSAN
jgi:hypothetical protein